MTTARAVVVAAIVVAFAIFPCAIVAAAIAVAAKSVRSFGGQLFARRPAEDPIPIQTGRGPQGSTPKVCPTFGGPSPIRPRPIYAGYRILYALIKEKAETNAALPKIK